MEKAGIQYMLTGSIASSLQGEPRATHDIDIVVLIEQGSINPLMLSFPPPEFYLDRQSIISAVSQHGMFNLLDVRGGTKVDFWLLTDDPFDKSRFSRRRRRPVFNHNLFVSTPEDTILSKLRWAKESGGSEKHLLDALRVYEVQYHMLDQSYLQAWVEKLQVKDLWNILIERAEPTD